MMVVPLGSGAAGALGGKAAALDRCLAAGLPVPPGVALDAAAARAVADADPEALQTLIRSLRGLDGPFAVRSSAAAEDGAAASFAGQLATVLGVDVAGVPAAVGAVLASGETMTVGAYRRSRGLPEADPVHVLVERLVEPRTAGVLFTHDPVTGEPGVVIEATWGLGTAVVEGLVVPDRITPAGYEPGDKDVEQRAGPQGLTEVAVPESRRRARCLDDAEVAALRALAVRVQAVLLQARLDVEWAIDLPGRLWLLQARPITTAV